MGEKEPCEVEQQVDPFLPSSTRQRVRADRSGGEIGDPLGSLPAAPVKAERLLDAQQIYDTRENSHFVSSSVLEKKSRFA